MISVEGNEMVEYNKDYIPENASFVPSTLWQCESEMYRSFIQLSLQPSSGLMFEIFQPGNEEQLPTGTFSMGSACEEGFLASFYPGAGTKATGICFSAGTISIEKEGEKYNIEMNLSIDPQCGGGTIIGNFNGKISGSQD